MTDKELAPLRKITGKRMRLLTVRVSAVWPRSAYNRQVREFQVFLDCGHEAFVPFGRRPKVGRRMRCKSCTADRRPDGDDTDPRRIAQEKLIDSALCPGCGAARPPASPSSNLCGPCLTGRKS